MRRESIRHGATLIGILVLAGALRLYYVLVLPGQGRDLLHSDMFVYDFSGWHMAQNEPLPEKNAVLGFNGYHPLSSSTLYYAGYTYFVAAVHKLFGHSPLAVRVLHAVLGTATVGLVYVVGAMIFSRRAALIAAALTAFHLPLVYYSGLLTTETWFIFLQFATLALWLRAWGARGEALGINSAAASAPELSTSVRNEADGRISLSLACVAGLVAGLACISRTAFGPAIAALAVGALIVPLAAADRSRRMALSSAFALAAGVVIAVIVIRNYQIHERFIPITTNGPITFYAAYVSHGMPDPNRVSPGDTDATVSDRYLRESLDHLRNNWRTYMEEVPEHFHGIWLTSDYWPHAIQYWLYRPAFMAEIPVRQKVVVHEPTAPPYSRLTHFPDLARYGDAITWLVIGLPLGLLAAIFLPRDHRRWTCLYWTLVPYLIIPLIAPPFPRYRLPAVPLFFILAGQTISVLWQLRRYWARSV